MAEYSNGLIKYSFIFFTRINSLSGQMREQRLLLEKMYEVITKNDVSRTLSDD